MPSRSKSRRHKRCDHDSHRHRHDYNDGGVKPSWVNILVSQWLRLTTAIILLIVVSERTVAWVGYNSKDIPIGFILGAAWLVAIISIAASIFAIVGVMQDRNL